jgi:hypothetical protein
VRAIVLPWGVIDLTDTGMTLKVLQFLALVLTALALVPAGAHFFELPNKIGLPQDQYFIVQGIYRGWALFGFVLFPALAAALALTIAQRHRHAAYRLALAAFLCIAANVAIFFAFTYPTNVATSNWTVVPANWQELRTRWEVSHAVNAVFMFAALCLLHLSTLSTSAGEARGHAPTRP